MNLEQRSDMTGLTNIRLELLQLDIPLVRPFVNAGSAVVGRTIGLVRMSRDGAIGWGEASPYPGQDDGLNSALASAADGRMSPTLAAGMDQASHDLTARLAQQTLASQVGLVRDRVPMSLAVGVGVGASDAVSDAVDRGVRRFKVKVAPGQVGNVREIRNRHPNVSLGIDANGSFSIDTVSELAELADLNLAYVEEPAGATDLEVIAEVRRYIDAPIFADESVRSLVDIGTLAGARNVDGIVIKPGRFGFSGALEATALADSLGLRWRASGLLETSVGRSFTNVLAGLPNAFVSDVAPADWFLERDVAVTVIDEGSVVRPDGPGIGFEPDQAVIERYLVARHDLSHLLGA